MVLAYHVIITMYGFWLPNDPRGSWSTFVGSWELLRHGPATKVATRRSLAHDAHDRRKRLEAKKALLYPPILLTGVQARSIAKGIARALREGGYVVYAFAILPDHIHLIIARHARPIGQIVAHMKARATQQLLEEGLHPFSDQRRVDGSLPSIWTKRFWKVFVDQEQWVGNAIEYVTRNPEKEGKRKQNWSFVTRWGA